MKETFSGNKDGTRRRNDDGGVVSWPKYTSWETVVERQQRNDGRQQPEWDWAARNWILHHTTRLFICESDWAYTHVEIDFLFIVCALNGRWVLEKWREAARKTLQHTECVQTKRAQMAVSTQLSFEIVPLCVCVCANFTRNGMIVVQQKGVNKGKNSHYSEEGTRIHVMFSCLRAEGLWICKTRQLPLEFDNVKKLSILMKDIFNSAKIVIWTLLAN